MTKRTDEKNERLVLPEERLDLDAGYGPLRLTERREAHRAAGATGWADSIGAMLQGVSLLR